MGQLIIGLVFFLSVSLTCYSAIGGELAYTCEVIHVYALADDGSLQTSSMEKEFRGNQFSVSRVTGEIIGYVVPTLLAKATRVINQGNHEYSFKAIADFGNQVQLIEVQEFAQGQQKPFIATSMGGAGIVTGVCR